MRDLAFNKRASFDYELLERFEAGLQLVGTEVKSVRAGNMSLRGAFVVMHGTQAQLINALIPAWQPANTPEDYDATRPRNLLLNKAELDRLIGAKQAQGLTIVPIRVYNNRSGKLKIEIALAKGKKIHSKKEQKRERDIHRDVDRMLRGKE